METTGCDDMEDLFYFFSCLISCTIVIVLACQFWEVRYVRAFQNPVIYKAVPVTAIIILTLVNLQKTPVWNMIVNVLAFGIISFVCYRDKKDKKYHRVLESECLLLMLAVLENLGGVLLYFLVEKHGFMPENALVKYSIEVVFSKLLVVFFGYALIRKLQKKERRQSEERVLMFCMTVLYGISNFVVIIVKVAYQSDFFLPFTNFFCIIFVILYLTYFMRAEDEKKGMEFRIAMMKQQEELQFDYYEAQREKYRQSVSILHDVNRHIRSIEELYRLDKKEEALEYTRQIGSILKPLVPKEYSDNPMLNIILADKQQSAESLGIQFMIQVECGKLDFLEPVDVTTLFGNLLDNALEACKKCSGERYIQIHIRNYNEMVSVRIMNSVQTEVKLKNGRPVGAEESRGGIGSLNVERCVEKYGGSILYKNADGKFYSDVILNR